MAIQFIRKELRKNILWHSPPSLVHITMPKATPTLLSHRGSAAWAIALKYIYIYLGLDFFQPLFFGNPCLCCSSPEVMWLLRSYSQRKGSSFTARHIADSDLVGWWSMVLVDWLIGWLVDWLIGWLVDWLIGWLVDWLVGWLVVAARDFFSIVNDGGSWVVMQRDLIHTPVVCGRFVNILLPICIMTFLIYREKCSIFGEILDGYTLQSKLRKKLLPKKITRVS